MTIRREIGQPRYSTPETPHSYEAQTVGISSRGRRPLYREGSSCS